tara:strand:- start:1362 stop:2939 length:1578 start_codon:yes stop_codon:yes gene_type:complete
MKLFRNNLVSVSFGTLLSKIIGFLRQILIAATFGVGITYDAYNYAYIIPSFLIITIGGINGPLHNAIVAVLTPLNSEKTSLILKRVSLKITLVLFIIGLLIFSYSSQLISIIGPNLDVETQKIASYQLRILSPCVPLSGFIGLSFGALNSKNKFFLSSLSPSIISIVTIVFISLSWFNSGENGYFYIEDQIELLALATLTGTIIQFSIQIFEIKKIGLLNEKINWTKSLNEEKRIFKLVIPASLSSGLSQINVFIDMFFASSFKGAASGLAYGNFLIQAPLGILSNTLILPLLPQFAKLASGKHYKRLQENLVSGIEFCFLATFFFAALFIYFNEQIIELIFQRGVFTTEAALTVRKILIAYAIGMPLYLLKDLLIRTYYSLERTKLPFKLSILGIALNILFDWVLIGAPINSMKSLLPFNFGVVGIILSTMFVNFIICLILTRSLRYNSIKLPNLILLRKIIYILIACILSSLLTHLLIGNHFYQDFIFKLLSLIARMAIFLFFYLAFTKLFGVNKLNFNMLNN